MCYSKLDLGVRPKCTIDGCNNDCQVVGKRSDGTRTFRKVCTSHHTKAICKKRGLQNIKLVIAENAGYSNVKDYLDFTARSKGFDNHNDYLDFTARSKGFDNHNDYQNSIHPYRKHRKTFCENVDGRLGFNCTTTIVWNGMLDVDHIDGNPSNNKSENLQTLCKCCHSYKSNINEDYKSPGRKFLNINY